MIKLNDTQKKGLGIIRILSGLILLAFGVMKFGADAAMIKKVGGAAHELGFTFLSKTVWFWIAVSGEIVAGFLLICGKFAKTGALLALIIMIFAVNSQGWMPPAIFVVLAALIILTLGSGYRVFNKGRFQKNGSCCSKEKTCSICGNNPCTCEIK